MTRRELFRLVALAPFARALPVVTPTPACIWQWNAADIAAAFQVPLPLILSPNDVRRCEVIDVTSFSDQYFQYRVAVDERHTFHRRDVFDALTEAK